MTQNLQNFLSIFMRRTPILHMFGITYDLTSFFASADPKIGQMTGGPVQTTEESR
jgi:hypothetical protein